MTVIRAKPLRGESDINAVRQGFKQKHPFAHVRAVQDNDKRTMVDIVPGSQPYAFTEDTVLMPFNEISGLHRWS
jgi:hypothetical protein